MNRLQNGLTALRAVARLPRCARQAPATAPLATGAPDGLAAATHCAVTMNLEGGRKVTYWGSCDDVEAMDRAGPSRTPFSVVAVTDVDGAGSPGMQRDGLPSPTGRRDHVLALRSVPHFALLLRRMPEARLEASTSKQCPRFCALPRGSCGGGDELAGRPKVNWVCVNQLSVASSESRDFSSGPTPGRRGRRR